MLEPTTSWPSSTPVTAADAVPAGSSLPNTSGRAGPPRPQVHTAGAVDEGELVGVDVEARQHGRGVAGVGHRRGEQLALRAHRHELARTHRERAREQPGEAGEQHGRGGGPAADDAEHQREVADETVVGPEDGRAERARHPRAPPRREPAHHLLVDALVGGHRGVASASAA